MYGLCIGNDDEVNKGKPHYFRKVINGKNYDYYVRKIKREKAKLSKHERSESIRRL